MGIWEDLTGQTAANAARGAAADTYDKQSGAAYGQMDAGNDYARSMARLGGMYAPISNSGAALSRASLDPLTRLLSDPSSVRSLPGYQFQMDEGARALDHSAAARGMLQSGRGSKDMLRFSQGLADSTLGNWLQRFAGLNQQGTQQMLSGTAGQVGAEGQGYAGQLNARGSAYDKLYGGAGTVAQGNIAGANAEAAGTQNLMNMGMRVAGMAMGLPWGSLDVSSIWNPVAGAVRGGS